MFDKTKIYTLEEVSEVVSKSREKTLKSYIHAYDVKPFNIQNNEMTYLGKDLERMIFKIVMRVPPLKAKQLSDTRKYSFMELIDKLEITKKEFFKHYVRLHGLKPIATIHSNEEGYREVYLGKQVNAITNEIMNMG